MWPPKSTENRSKGSTHIERKEMLSKIIMFTSAASSLCRNPMNEMNFGLF